MASSQLVASESFVLYEGHMRTKVTKPGQVSVPVKVRRKLNIGPDTILEWVVEGAIAKVTPLAADPVQAFRGSGMVKRLLEDGDGLGESDPPGSRPHRLDETGLLQFLHETGVHEFVRSTASGFG